MRSTSHTCLPYTLDRISLQYANTASLSQFTELLLVRWQGKLLRWCRANVTEIWVVTCLIYSRDAKLTRKLINRMTKKKMHVMVFDLLCTDKHEGKNEVNNIRDEQIRYFANEAPDLNCSLLTGAKAVLCSNHFLQTGLHLFLPFHYGLNEVRFCAYYCCGS